jgi:flagellar biosynthesis protein FlhG
MSSQIISITSGKGGVGKSVSTVYFAYLSRLMGKKVLIIDGDLGLSNVEILMNLRPRYSLRDVLDGNAKIDDVVMEDTTGVRVISSGSGISSLTTLNNLEKSVLIDQCQSLSQSFDYTFIDTGAGINDSVISLNSFSSKNIIVTTPEPHAITDAYAIMKVMSEKLSRKTFYLLVNQTRFRGEGLNVFERLSDVSNKFLGINIRFLGSVPFDREVSLNVLRRNIPYKHITQTLAGQAWQEALFKLREQSHDSHRGDSSKLSDIWGQVIQASSESYF